MNILSDYSLVADQLGSDDEWGVSEDALLPASLKHEGWLILNMNYRAHLNLMAINSLNSLLLDHSLLWENSKYSRAGNFCNYR